MDSKMSSHRNEAISILHIRAVVKEQVSNQANSYCHFVLLCTFLVNVSNNSLFIALFL